MLKFILILFLIIYAFYKISTFFLRRFIVNKFASNTKKNRNGINIDHVPNKNKKTILDDEGDFVDYEEVD